jgi:ABC-type dipeptide/oligopeptide/nickel transport system permease subunit
MRRTAWSESLADLLLFPADVLLLLPAPALALTLVLILPPQRTSTAVGLVIAVVLLPRCVRFYQSLWIDAPRQHGRRKLGTAGLGALFLGSLFGGLSLIAAMDFLGLGVPPPTPTLASLLYEGMMLLRMNPTPVIAAGFVLWVCAFALYTAADALIGSFHTKDAMSKLNE